MEIFRLLEQDNFEQVVFCNDTQTGLKAIIAIHDTTLGPALGGVRMWKYHTEQEALQDVLRLAKGMTYKNAVAGIDFGGGKAVIMEPEHITNREGLFRSFGKYVASLNGRYITAEDVGTFKTDMDFIRTETTYVTGTSSGGVGDPSPITALGVYYGMKAAAKEAFGTDELRNKTIAIQGVGQVAYHMCKHLHAEGANLVVTDINKQAVARAVKDFNATSVSPDEIYDVSCDIFSPCALGGTINEATIKRLKAKVIAGSANNQLLHPHIGKLLLEQGIIYAPDYLINAGGVTAVSEEIKGYDKARVLQKVSSIYSILENVFYISKTEKIPTSEAADKIAERRMNQMRQLKKMYVPATKHGGWGCE